MRRGLLEPGFKGGVRFPRPRTRGKVPGLGRSLGSRRTQTCRCSGHGQADRQTDRVGRAAESPVPSERSHWRSQGDVSRPTTCSSRGLQTPRAGRSSWRSGRSRQAVPWAVAAAAEGHLWTLGWSKEGVSSWKMATPTWWSGTRLLGPWPPTRAGGGTESLWGSRAGESSVPGWGRPAPPSHLPRGSRFSGSAASRLGCRSVGCAVQQDPLDDANVLVCAAGLRHGELAGGRAGG